MGAQGLVIDDHERVLLVRHGYRKGWHFPGGGVERNETLRTTLARELREEVGIELTDTPLLHGLFANFSAFPSDHIAVFIVRDWHQPVIPKPNTEIAEQRFFMRDALPDGTVSGARRRIEEIFEGAAVSEDW